MHAGRSDLSKSTSPKNEQSSKVALATLSSESAKRSQPNSEEARLPKKKKKDPSFAASALGTSSSSSFPSLKEDVLADVPEESAAAKKRVQERYLL